MVVSGGIVLIAIANVTTASLSQGQKNNTESKDE